MHVALAQKALGASPLLGDAVGGLEDVVEIAVIIILTLVPQDHVGTHLNGVQEATINDVLRRGGGGGDQAGGEENLSTTHRDGEEGGVFVLL